MNLQIQRPSISPTGHTSIAAQALGQVNELHGTDLFDVREYRDRNAASFSVIQLAVELIPPNGGELRSKPWLAMAFDTHQMKLLGWKACAQKPDGVKLAGFIERVIRKHGQIPKMLATDPAEIKRSDRLSQLCVRHGITRLLLPTSRYRSAVIERMLHRILR